MLVSWKWLCELINLKDMTPEEGAAILTHAGLEVEGIEKLNKGVTGVVTGKILSVEPHPNASKLVVCKVDAGQGRELTIATGAPHVKAGDCVPVALVGAKLPCDTHPSIELTDLRGVMSEGMMCGADEIGLDVNKLLPEEKDGLYPLPSDTVPGEDIVKFLGLDDTVLDIGLTPNRSDCMGIVNIAREMGGLTGCELTLPHTPESTEKGDISDLAYVKITDDGVCSRFGARMVMDVKVGPSPLWMKQRLNAMGMRSINNVVDISNLVMLELNRPVHFFDYDKLVGHGLTIRLAKSGETIETLDDNNRELSTEMGVVCDEQGPVAVGGVMGGARTEVTEDTKRILIEAACWNGTRIRRTSFALGLRSEASMRFEKEVDADETIHTLDRCVQLLEECGAAKGVSGYLDIYSNKVEPAITKVRLDRINFVLGTDVNRELVDKIWKDLKIEILEEDENHWVLKAPSYRKDLSIEEDYIEEVARIYGYDKLVATLPYGGTTQGKRLPLYDFRKKITRLAISCGYMEVVNYAFINPGHLDKLNVPENHPWRNAVVVMNPLSEEQGIMRTTIIPSMIDVAVRNINHRNKDLRLFELGKVYFANEDKNKQPDERWTLSMVCTGLDEKTWFGQAQNMDFFTLKGAVEEILLGCNIKDVEYVPATDIPGLHKGRTARIMAKDNVLGYIGEVDPGVLDIYGTDQRLIVASLDAARMFDAKSEIVYENLSKYPDVTRDIAVVVPKETLSVDVAKLIKSLGGDLLANCRLFDEYMGEQLGSGNKSLAFALTFRAKDRTLKDDEIKALHDTIEAKLGETFGAQIRGR